MCYQPAIDSNRNPPPTPGLFIKGKSMNNCFGFELEWKRDVKELDSTVSLWVHKKSGASLLSCCNKDENKVFGVSFRTPPEDSSGVAHILEHSVLNGSKKYPSKEPFVELLKGSLQTFLNAFTYPDKTCYPVASANLQDFYNLVDVYLDAVFHPLITRATFEQEGWHIDAESPDGPLAYKGVVYNEMKGVYSSPDSILAEQAQQSLFPDTTYGLDSGGRPDAIPALTYEQFKAFHASFYHPANGRFFFWGDDPEERRLELLNGVLKDFERIQVNSEVRLQPKFTNPHHIEVPYAVGEEENGEPGKYMLTMNWKLPETTGVEENFALQMLDHILIGLPGSPLRRALIESGLGEDITGHGLENELREMFFSIGLRGVNGENIQDVEVLIMDTLCAIYEDGVPAEAVEAAVNSVEFALREKNSGRFPVGLAVMLSSLTTWLYDADPLALLEYEKPLAGIKERLASKERVFENLIKKWFLENGHRSTVVLVPDAKIAKAKAEEEAGTLARIRQSFSRAELDSLVERTRELRAIQEAPENPEALAAIPMLKVKDLPSENKPIPRENLDFSGTPLLFNPQPTAGIVYADLMFNIAHVEPALLPLTSLFGRAILEMGNKKRDFAELGMHMAAKTGGLQADSLFLTNRADQGTFPGFSVSGKATRDKADDLAAIFREVLLETDFDDQARFAQMVLEEKARQEQGMIPAGHSVVALRLAATMSQAAHLSELTGGVSYLDYLRDLSGRVEKDWGSILAELETLRSRLISREGLSLNLICRQEDFSICRDALGSLLEALPGKASDETPFARLPPAAFSPRRADEALILPAQVNYVGQGVNLYELGYKYHGSIHVALKYLRTGYLWEEIRVKGGAYGAMANFDRMSGVLCLVSYRDPNVENTLNVYSRVGEHLKRLSFDAGELDRSIIGAIGELDTHLLPDAKGSASFSRLLTGDTDEARQKMREEILSTTLEDFHALGEALSGLGKGNTCMLGGPAVEEYAKAKGIASRKV